MDKRFFCSGFNSHFQDGNENFSAYISRMRDIISRTRVDLNAQNFDAILQANSPSEFIPDHGTQEYGILLVHGLTASPFHLADIFEHFQKQNYCIHSVLLPGHGTVPGDLLEVNYQDWLAMVSYGIKCLRKHVKKVIVVGYSLGAELCLLEAYGNPDIAALVCFAPAIQIRNPFAFISSWHRCISWAIPRLKWYHVDIDNDYSKYNSQPYNAIYQVYALTKHFEQKAKTMTLDKPLFIILSQDDEVISPQAAEAFFKKQSHPANKMVIYGRDQKVQSEKIIVKSSQFKNENILDFSHVCLATAPSNPHYGNKADFEEDRHYRRWWGKPYDTKRDQPKYYGAITKENLANYHLMRLTYNPDFENLMTDIDNFIAKLYVTR